MRWSVALLALFLAVALAGCEASEEAEPGGARAPAHVSIAELEPCGRVPEPEGFRCGSITVPFERSDPSYGKTEVAFAVRRRDRRDRRALGTIFAQEGGPGYASTGTANAYTKLFGDLLERYDLVLVDMRGTGLSDPIDCPDLQKGLGPEWIGLPQCARRLGKRFISYRTSAAADDLNDVRRALGLDEITLYGDSYGTFFAQSYAFRHGDTLNAMVLDSAYPTRGESAWYPSLIETGNEALELACRRSPQCPPGAAKRLEKLVDHLRESGRTVEPLLGALAGATYGTPESYLEIDEAGRRLVKGNAGRWNELTAEAIKPNAGDPLEYLRAAEMAVSCNDYPLIWDRSSPQRERHAQLERAIRNHDPDTFAPFTPREIALSTNFGYQYCLTWPRPTDVYEPPISDGDKPTPAPVLVVAGEMDNLTAPEEGRKVANEFPHSELFVARNAGHINALYYRDGEAAREIRRFIRENAG
jgi:pimeloyl-ACP methyl ester carboxylesterase